MTRDCDAADHPQADADEVMWQRARLAGDPVFLQGYMSGLIAGIPIGRDQANAEMDAVWAQTARQVRALAKQPTYLELCERRGEPDRAARAREQQVRLGLRNAS